MAILVGLTKPVRGKPILLGRPHETRKWELGRGKTGDILIDHESVSGCHAQVIGEQGRWRVVNLMSVNGTFVNDRKVLSAFLNSGDCIRMGVVDLAFDAPVSKARSRTGRGGWWARFLSLFGRK